MKILMVGQFTGYHAENSILHALRRLGVEVVVVNVSDYFRLSVLNRTINKLRAVPYYFGVGALNKAVIRASEQARLDFILFIKPIYITPKTITLLKRHSSTALYSWDFDYIDFKKNYSTYFYQSIPLFDCLIASNPQSAKIFPQYGAKKAVTILMTVDKDLFRKEKLTDAERIRWGADVVFVGNYAPEVRADFCERLCRDGYNIKVYGFGWDNLGRGSCLVRCGRIEPLQLGVPGMIKAYGASKVALAFAREHNKEETGLRSWEIPLCGCFMLHSRTKFIGHFYQEGKEAEFFGLYDEMRGKIDRYLREDKSRKDIARAGEKRIRESNNFIIDHVNTLLTMHTNGSLAPK